jgi:hypothetical protein
MRRRTGLLLVVGAVILAGACRREVEPRPATPAEADSGTSLHTDAPGSTT